MALLYLLVLISLVSGLQRNIKIANGLLREIDNYRFMASLQKPTTTGGRTFAHYCGGTILGHSWILTASHCVTKPENRSEIRNLKGEMVVVGTARLGPSGSPEPGAQKAWIKTAYASPHYTRPDRKEHPYDLALIELVKPLQSRGIAKIHLWKKLPLEKAGDVEVLGWGKMTPGGENAQFLRGYTTKLYEPCKKPEFVFCIANPSGSGHCAGDDGGPIISKMELFPGQYEWVQLGVIPDDGRACNFQSSVAWSSSGLIGPYCDWIAQTTGTNFCHDH
ncbi:unnamed protein product, partial [Mesorhabditis spiculigera]